MSVTITMRGGGGGGGSPASLVRAAGAILAKAVSAARLELAERGAVSPTSWDLLELLAGELERRLDELERARRLGALI